MKKIFLCLIWMLFVFSTVFGEQVSQPKLVSGDVSQTLALDDCYKLALKQSELIAVDAEKIKEAGIPYIKIERGYSLANVGQLKTRVGAFLEMIETQKR